MTEVFLEKKGGEREGTNSINKDELMAANMSMKQHNIYSLKMEDECGMLDCAYHQIHFGKEGGGLEKGEKHILNFN